MAEDPRLKHNNDRVAHQQEIEDAIITWTQQYTLPEVVEILEAAEVPVGPIYSVVDMLQDPHFLARGVFEDCTLPDGSSVKLPTIAPKMSETPGGTEWIGPPLGAHNQEVLGELLGLSEQELQELAAEGVITPLEAPASL
jgi:crotonobetainyl-CoA:carnitine CoA-transferase CaiB-like acyl-CoA transferase